MKEVGLPILTCAFLMTRPFMLCPIHFKLVTLMIDLLFKNLNLVHSFLTVRGSVFIFHVFFVTRPFTTYHNFFDLVTLTWKFDLLFKNFVLGYDFWIRTVISLLFTCGCPGELCCLSDNSESNYMDILLFYMTLMVAFYQQLINLNAHLVRVELLLFMI